MDFVQPFQNILRCISDIGFVPGGSKPGGPYVAFFQGRRVPLRRAHGLAPIYFSVFVDYNVEPSVDRAGWWEAYIIGWVYDILDTEGRPILAFHWHPSSGRVTPGTGPGAGGRAEHRAGRRGTGGGRTCMRTA